MMTFRHQNLSVLAAQHESIQQGGGEAYGNPWCMMRH
jgi:hypothetical protein